MTRKASFSIALALTTLVTFALVSISVRAGFFGLGGDSRGAQTATAQAAQLDNSQTRSYELSLAPASASPTPRVTTEYVYYDDGTYVPAPEAAADTSGNAGGSPSNANSDPQNLAGANQTPGSPANETLQPLPSGGERSTPTPELTASPQPEEHLPEITPTPRPKAPHQEPADDPQPSNTTAPHETEQPQVTQESRETEEPRATAQPQETPEPQQTQEPRETPEQHDD